MKNMKSNNLLLLFSILLIIGGAGYFGMRGQMLGYVFAHIGGASIVGLLALAAGKIALGKGYGFSLAFHIGFTFSLLLGTAAVFLFYIAGESNQFACGGSVSLLFSLLVISYYGLAEQRNAGI